MYITDESIDDLLAKIYKKIQKNGKRVDATRGANVEILGVNICLKNPRSRLSRSLSKGKVFSAVGELLWYLAGDNSLDFICHYLSKYGENSDDKKTIHGAYGPRLFGTNNGINQITNVIKLLKNRASSRRAVIALFQAEDICEHYTDIPCTTTMQFVIRDSFLHMFVSMRSNDAYKGLPHDIFAFTMIQELVAKSLGLNLGHYHHAVSSLHLYDADLEPVTSYLEEGYQQILKMPEMPNIDPWEALDKVLIIEKNIRLGNDVNLESIALHDYWKDICHLLEYFSYFKNENIPMCEMVIKSMKHEFYIPYLKNKTLEKKKQKEQLNLVFHVDGMLDVIKSNLDQIESASEESVNLLSEGQPIQYFGNINQAKIATIGLNPSDKEFYSDKYEELTSNSRRFHTLASLKIKNWVLLSKDDLVKVKYCMDSYFEINPYKRWFNQLENIFSDAGYSYYDNTACHIDLIPYATKIKWSSLKNREQQYLLSISIKDFQRCIKESHLEILILNGASVISGFLKTHDVNLDKELVSEWEVKTKKGIVNGYKYKGYLTLGNNKPILVLGYNYNLQSSFGLSREIKGSIKDWIVSELAINKLNGGVSNEL